MILYAMAAYVAVLQAIDWYTTRTLLASGKGTEANPITALLIRILGGSKIAVDVVMGAKFAVLSVAAFAAVKISDQHQTSIILTVLTILYTWIAVNNIRVLRK